jgi:hypothetical protein
MPIISLKTGTKSRSLLVGNPYFQPSSYESIASATGTGSSGTITFSSIPNTYTHLQIRFMALTATSTDYITINANSDTGSNYTWHILGGSGTVASAAGQANASYTYLDYNQPINTTNPSVGILDIHDYASTSKFKTGRCFTGCDKNGSGDVELNSFLWRSTSAISTLTFKLQGGSVNFATTTTFALYGIKGA